MPLKTAYITRRERFAAAHRLFRPDWTDEKNLEVFGKCSNPNWHGHNYILLVTLKGPVDPETGFVTDLKQVSKVIKERVISKVDHRNLNLDVDFMEGIITSTENLAIAIWEELVEPIEALGCSLHRVKVLETENNYVEYYGGA
ncbi:MAG: 6-carboxytetrahydropterin synthase [Bacteroidota bacterium]